MWYQNIPLSPCFSFQQPYCFKPHLGLSILFFHFWKTSSHGSRIYSILTEFSGGLWTSWVFLYITCWQSKHGVRGTLNGRQIIIGHERRAINLIPRVQFVPTTIRQFAKIFEQRRYTDGIHYVSHTARIKGIYPFHDNSNVGRTLGFYAIIVFGFWSSVSLDWRRSFC